MRILIVEDDQVLSSVLKRRLSKYQFECLCCTDHSDALLMCKQFEPDLILLDMHLKTSSGLSLIPLLKNSVPHTRIILMTGFASIATAVQAIKLGADEYLAKPIDTQTLLSAIKTVCSDNKLLPEIQVEKITKSVEHSDSVVTPPQRLPSSSNTLSSEQIEWEHIQQVLKFNQGNVSAAARQLSMHRRTLQRKLQKRPTFINKL